MHRIDTDSALAGCSLIRAGGSQTQTEAGEGGTADSSTAGGAATDEEDVIDAEIVDDEQKGGAG